MELPLSIVEAVYCFLISVSAEISAVIIFSTKQCSYTALAFSYCRSAFGALDDLVDDIYNAMVTTPLGGDNKHLREMRNIFEFATRRFPRSGKAYEMD